MPGIIFEITLYVEDSERGSVCEKKKNRRSRREHEHAFTQTQTHTSFPPSVNTLHEDIRIDEGDSLAFKPTLLFLPAANTSVSGCRDRIQHL